MTGAPGKVEKVERLLALAAGGANENESAAAALQAARIIRENHLTIGAGPARGVECIMCQPADGPGVCRRCGRSGLGPGHACPCPRPGTLCEVHATWRVQTDASSPAGYPPYGGFPFGIPYVPHAYSRGYAHPARPSSESDRSPSDARLEKLRGELRRSQARARRLERELERLRSGSSPPRPVVGEAVPDDVLFRTIGQLGMRPPQYATRLENRGFELVGEVVQRTRRELLMTKNLGRKTVDELERVLAPLGLALGTRIDDWSERYGRWLDSHPHETDPNP